LSNEVEILNPLPGGLRKTSLSRANNFVARGLAVMENHKLQFLSGGHGERSEEGEFGHNRGGILFWNGAMSKYANGVDIAMYPPGCNVLFPKVGTLRAAKRYAELQL